MLCRSFRGPSAVDLNLNRAAQALLHLLPQPPSPAGSTQRSRSRARLCTTGTRHGGRILLRCHPRRRCQVLLLHHRRPTALSILLPRLGTAQSCHGLQSLYPYPRTVPGTCLPLPLIRGQLHTGPQEDDLVSHRLVLYSSNDPRRKANAALLMALYVVSGLSACAYTFSHATSPSR